MGVNKKADELLNAIEVPYTVNSKQSEIAKRLVKAKMMDDFNVQEFCKSNNISTKSYYGYFENPDFQYYVQQLQAAIVPTDEKQAYQKIKQKILKLADKPNLSIKEIELFTNTFSYVVELDKQERLQALGLNENKKPDKSKTVEERKASLLARLTSGRTKTKEDTDELDKTNTTKGEDAND